jgi:AraC-like DNA-binding protein
VARSFLGEEDHPAMSSLPSCIQVPAHGGQATEWLRGLSAALVAEADEGGRGSEIVMARLSDALVTRALRHHLQTADEPGWLRGLRDPAIARALTALHADLAAQWSVASLARAADMSRAAFAARFQRTMGQAPMAYVTQVRIRTAMALLRSDRATVATVASRVGYGSEPPCPQPSSGTPAPHPVPIAEPLLKLSRPNHRRCPHDRADRSAPHPILRPDIVVAPFGDTVLPGSEWAMVVSTEVEVLSKGRGWLLVIPAFAEFDATAAARPFAVLRAALLAPKLQRPVVNASELVLSDEVGRQPDMARPPVSYGNRTLISRRNPTMSPA